MCIVIATWVPRKIDSGAKVKCYTLLRGANSGQEVREMASEARKNWKQIQGMHFQDDATSNANRYSHI